MTKSHSGTQSRSTKNVNVYGLKRPDKDAEKILYMKSRRIKSVKDFLLDSDEKSRHLFERYFYIFYKMLFNYLTASERLLLWFDNSAIQSVIHKDKSVERMPQFNALLAFLSLAEDYCLVDVFCCISPTIMFEANHRRLITNTENAYNVVKIIDEAMEQVGLETRSVGFYNIKQLIDATRNIKIDEEEIHKAVLAMRKLDWKYDALSERGTYTPLPMALAEHYTPEVRLRYFEPWYVKHVLMSCIVKEMYDANEGIQPFRDFCKQEMDRGFWSIINLKGGQLRGLGDIELYTNCELNTQSAIRSPNICMAVSFDENLNKVLWSRMQTRGPSLSFTHGDDIESHSSAFAYSAIHEGKITKKINSRSKEYYQALSNFNDDVIKPCYVELGIHTAEADSTRDTP